MCAILDIHHSGTTFENLVRNVYYDIQYLIYNTTVKFTYFLFQEIVKRNVNDGKKHALWIVA